MRLMLISLVALVPFPLAADDDPSAAVSGDVVAAAAPAPSAAVEPASDATDATAKAETRDYAQISLEELLNKDITVAATKTRVDVAKAPVSVSVITPEDIRRSGATRVADVLRTVPGLDVLEAFPGHISVSARGTSEIFVNNMLLLIDGRRIEQQANGVAWIDKAALRVEDIKRIEVIKGPAGAIYGTNALAGIISITTFSPDEVQGTVASMTAGNRNTYHATVRHAGRLGQSQWTYKVVGGYSYTSTWSSLTETDTEPPIALRKGEALLVFDRQFADSGRLTLEGGLAEGDMASLTLVVPQTRYFTSPHFRIAYGRSDFHAQLSFSPQSVELRERSGPVQVLTDQAHSAHLSLDRTWRPSSETTFTFGGNARQQRTTFTNLGPPHAQWVGSAFAGMEQSLSDDRVRVVGAIGLGYHPHIALQLDGNAAIIFTPVRDHSLRVSFGRAHRDPSFGENFFDFRRKYPGNRDGYQAGNTDLAPESLISWEAGYHGSFRAGRSTLRLFAEGFRQDVKDLIAAPQITVPIGSIAAYPDATILQQFRNLEDRKGWGFETGGSWERDWFQLNGWYAFQRFENAATGALIQRDIPRHKLTGGVRLTRGALELDVWAHAVSRTISDTGYVLLNPRVGIKAGGWTASLQAFNVLNDVHAETGNAGRTGEQLRRAVSFSLSRALGAAR